MTLSRILLLYYRGNNMASKHYTWLNYIYPFKYKSYLVITNFDQNFDRSGRYEIQRCWRLFFGRPVSIELFVRRHCRRLFRKILDRNTKRHPDLHHRIVSSNTGSLMFLIDIFFFCDWQSFYFSKFFSSIFS